MSYADTVTRHRRLAILRHLAECSGYSSNASILTEVLRGVGITSTFSQVVTELTWLKDNGFATVEDTGGFVIAEATRAGVEIAQGHASHPEIQRPSAGR